MQTARCECSRSPATRQTKASLEQNLLPQMNQSFLSWQETHANVHSGYLGTILGLPSGLQRGSAHVFCKGPAVSTPGAAGHDPGCRWRPARRPSAKAAADGAEAGGCEPDVTQGHRNSRFLSFSHVTKHSSCESLFNRAKTSQPF